MTRRRSAPRSRSSASGTAPRMWSRLGLCAGLTLAATAPARGQSLDGLRVGHWVTAKGSYQGDGRLVCDEVQVTAPAGDHLLRGTVTSAEGNVLWILGQRVEVSDETRWRRVSLADVVGTRVEVEGAYKGERKFTAALVALRPTGRDRVAGRIDELRELSGGERVARIQRMTVVLSDETEIELVGHDRLEDVALAPLVRFGGLALDRRDDDDDVPQAFRLTEFLSAGVQLEWRSNDEREADLDAGDEEDRTENTLGVRAELVYRPPGNFTGFLGVRQSWRFRDDDEDGYSEESTTRLAELYGYWQDVLPGLDVQFGRQDFDERREWLYDQNLDALRLHWEGEDLRLELSASTVLSQGSDADEATDNLMAYLSNTDEDRHWGAYLIDRRDRRDPQDYPFFAGLRAHGEWLPQHDVWAELAAVRGYQGTQDLDGHALDLGTTWSPPALRPWYFTVGYALGSGDDEADDGVDGTFRQTGLHDNNDKFGGVTSFRYYGELADPDLSNLRVGTLGVGRRFGRNRSLDLVWHTYEQDALADRWRGAGISARPDGLHTDLGQELDLIFGSRSSAGWRVELVLATFEPGDAFAADAEQAWLGKVHLRYRF